MWRSQDEGIAFFALNIWAFSAEIIVIAPIWGSYMNLRYGWRWLWGISGIVGGVLTLLFVLMVPETRHVVLLEKRAKELRRKTGDDRYYVAGGVSSHRSINDILKETLYRPIFMLLTEPIVNLFAIWDGLN
jgi:MFS family permease